MLLDRFLVLLSDYTLPLELLYVPEKGNDSLFIGNIPNNFIGTSEKANASWNGILRICGELNFWISYMKFADAMKCANQKWELVKDSMKRRWPKRKHQCSKRLLQFLASLSMRRRNVLSSIWTVFLLCNCYPNV